MNNFCRIYIDTELDSESLCDLLVQDLKAQKVLTCVLEDGDVTIRVINSNDYDKNRKLEPGGFVFFKLNIEIDSGEDDLSDAYLEYIKKVLSWLSSKHISHVPSCSYEDLLIE